MYYEYIREEIIKKNKSPNFILLYSYFIAKGIDSHLANLNKCSKIK